MGGRLQADPGTVTHFLEEMTGETITADVIGQGSRRPTAAEARQLALSPGQVITHRRSILRGAGSHLSYVYAESLFEPGRLPPTARDQLEHSDDPIGRVLDAHGISVSRAERPDVAALWPAGAPPPAAEALDVVWWRAYLLGQHELPLFAIAEWFLRPVLSAMERRDRAGAVRHD